jgi:hypothetical protein
MNVLMNLFRMLQRKGYNLLVVFGIDTKFLSGSPCQR